MLSERAGWSGKKWVLGAVGCENLALVPLLGWCVHAPWPGCQVSGIPAAAPMAPAPGGACTGWACVVCFLEAGRYTRGHCVLRIPSSGV